MKHGRVILETTGDVAVMTLNDPSVLNAFGLKLREDMAVAMDRVEASSARCLVITGAGRAFCSGANLNDADRASRDRAAEADGRVKSDLERWYNPMFMRLRALSIPIVTAINGMAAGAGMSLALTGDIRIAARSASFLQAFARIGLVPDCGSSWLLPRLIGMARAMELSLLAERLPAETALSWGLINRVVEDNALMPRALEEPRSPAITMKVWRHFEKSGQLNSPDASRPFSPVSSRPGSPAHTRISPHANWHCHRPIRGRNRIKRRGLCHDHSPPS
jgi:2-(1,2-epoxy-1,2-dihydrophenyl)acetyl-CoA isomerase